MIAAALLALVLVILIPARALARSRRGMPEGPRATRYARTTMEIAGLLLALLIVMLLNRLSAQDLGLAWPPPRAGKIGLVIAAALIGGLVAALLLLKAPNSAREQEARTNLPGGRHEMAIYLLFAIAAGFGWEILYRGFLLWWLPRLFGLPLAVCTAALAYGLAHGWKNAREGFGSIIAAMLFTIAYAVTGSLWWLIITHVALPVVALLASWRGRSRGKEAVGT
jgi:membrane protease YdiL (CAAX protease family)